MNWQTIMDRALGIPDAVALENRDALRGDLVDRLSPGDWGKTDDERCDCGAAVFVAVLERAQDGRLDRWAVGLLDDAQVQALVVDVADRPMERWGEKLAEAQAKALLDAMRGHLFGDSESSR